MERGFCTLRSVLLRQSEASWCPFRKPRDILRFLTCWRIGEGIFTIIIFELLNLLLYMVLGLTDGTGRWNGLKKTCVTVFDALLAACLAPLPIQFAMDQISILMANGQGLRQIAGNIISCIVYAVVAGGAIVFLYVGTGIYVGEGDCFHSGKGRAD